MTDAVGLTTGELALLLFVYTVSQFGLCWIIADSKASRPVRRLIAFFAEHEASSRWTRVGASFVLALVECVACTGTWVGFLSGWYVARAAEIAPLPLALVLAFYTAAVNFVVGRKTDLL